VFTGTGEFDVGGTFNAADEQTGRGSDTLVYDAVGNLTDNGDDQEYVYDVFGRLVEVNDQSGNLIARYRYNGANQRIAFQHDTGARIKAARYSSCGVPSWGPSPPPSRAVCSGWWTARSATS
jgi:YD repeat-containing protein